MVRKNRTNLELISHVPGKYFISIPIPKSLLQQSEAESKQKLTYLYKLSARILSSIRHIGREQDHLVAILNRNFNS